METAESSNIPELRQTPKKETQPKPERLSLLPKNVKVAIAMDPPYGDIHDPEKDSDMPPRVIGTVKAIAESQLDKGNDYLHRSPSTYDIRVEVVDSDGHAIMEDYDNLKGENERRWTWGKGKKNKSREQREPKLTVFPTPEIDEKEQLRGHPEKGLSGARARVIALAEKLLAEGRLEEFDILTAYKNMTSEYVVDGDPLHAFPDSTYTASLRVEDYKKYLDSKKEDYLPVGYGISNAAMRDQVLVELSEATGDTQTISAQKGHAIHDPFYQESGGQSYGFEAASVAARDSWINLYSKIGAKEEGRLGAYPLDTFVSYSRDNSSEVDALIQRLDGSHHRNVWIDRRDIQAGTPWMDAIKKAIDRCPVLVLYLTPSSADNPYVREEVEYATGQNKQIVVVTTGDSNGRIKTPVPDWLPTKDIQMAIFPDPAMATTDAKGYEDRNNEVYRQFLGWVTKRPGATPQN